MRFIELLSRLGLLIFGAIALICALVLLILLSIPTEKLSSVGSGQSGLSSWIVSHPRTFAVAFLAYSIGACLASVGLGRLKLWAYVSWIVLLLLAMLWAVVSVSAEVYGLLHLSADTPRGFSPSWPVLSALVVSLVGLGGVAVGAVLLRKLTAAPTKRLFDRG